MNQIKIWNKQKENRKIAIQLHFNFKLKSKPLIDPEEWYCYAFNFRIGKFTSTVDIFNSVKKKLIQLLLTGQILASRKENTVLVPLLIRLVFTKVTNVHVFLQQVMNFKFSLLKKNVAWIMLRKIVKLWLKCNLLMIWMKLENIYERKTSIFNLEESNPKNIHKKIEVLFFDGNFEYDTSRAMSEWLFLIQIILGW